MNQSYIPLALARTKMTLLSDELSDKAKMKEVA